MKPVFLGTLAKDESNNITHINATYKTQPATKKQRKCNKLHWATTKLRHNNMKSLLAK